MQLSRYRKTLVAAVPLALAGLKVLSDALGDGIVSEQELVAVAIAALTPALVYVVPNTAPAGTPADPDVSEQAGA